MSMIHVGLFKAVLLPKAKYRFSHLYSMNCTDERNRLDYDYLLVTGELLMRTTLAILITFAIGSAVFGQAGTTSSASTERIAKEVRHELVTLPYFSVFDNLAYKVDGNDVALIGQVTRPTLKSDAENVVKRIEGVEHVDNQIEVLPTSSMDDGLRLQLYRAIYGFPALQKYALGVQQPIRIIVKNGKVTLEGVVDNESDKNIAYVQASGVSGIFSVTNNLQVPSK